MRTFTVLMLTLLLGGSLGTFPAQAQVPVPPGPMIGLQQLAEGLTSPVTLVEPPDASGRLFVVDQIGQIWILSPDGSLLPEPFLDIQERLVDLEEEYDERGLLGLAFHPEYADNGRFFVYYSAPLRPEGPPDWDNTSHISEFIVSSDSNKADPGSERILLQVDQPQDNHAAGTLSFGPDGYLYISLGDGGGANDNELGHVEDWFAANEGGNGQDLSENLLGSILRIDVDEGDPYGIPPDNPFAGDTLAEQYAYGFRNPYRFSFDRGGNNDLFVGDAGQDLWEEVSIVTAGGNYGWNVKEGTHCFDAEDPENPPAECPQVVGAGHPRAGDPLIDPVIEFLNANQEGGLGLVVVGGYVYRGARLPELDGRYIFGTWSSGEEEVEGGGEEGEIHFPGRLFIAEAREDSLWPLQQLRIANMPGDSLRHFLLGFGQDLGGEMYVLTTDSVGPAGSSGKVYGIVPPGDVTAGEPGAELPTASSLEQNYPNPFNPTTTIRFQVARAGLVTLKVYDLLGREVVTLANEQMLPGTYAVVWDGRDEAGRPAASGTYFYRIQSGESSGVKAMILLK